MWHLYQPLRAIIPLNLVNSILYPCFSSCSGELKCHSCNTWSGNWWALAGALPGAFVFTVGTFLRPPQDLCRNVGWQEIWEYGDRWLYLVRILPHCGRCIGSILPEKNMALKSCSLYLASNSLTILLVLASAVNLPSNPSIQVVVSSSCQYSCWRNHIFSLSSISKASYGSLLGWTYLMQLLTLSHWIQASCAHSVSANQ